LGGEEVGLAAGWLHDGESKIGMFQSTSAIFSGNGKRYSNPPRWGMNLPERLDRSGVENRRGRVRVTGTGDEV
jgi:hypothetical protein